MTTALEGGEGSAAWPGRTLPPGKTRYPLYRRLVGPQGRSGQVQKISPPTGIRSPDRPACRQSLYRLSYPAHTISVTWSKSDNITTFGQIVSGILPKSFNIFHTITRRNSHLGSGFVWCLRCVKKAYWHFLVDKANYSCLSKQLQCWHWTVPQESFCKLKTIIVRNNIKLIIKLYSEPAQSSTHNHNLWPEYPPSTPPMGCTACTEP
jgi:hypothetical protein